MRGSSGRAGGSGGVGAYGTLASGAASTPASSAAPASATGSEPQPAAKSEARSSERPAATRRVCHDAFDGALEATPRASYPALVRRPRRPVLPLLAVALLPATPACSVLFPFAPSAEGARTCAEVLAEDPGAASGEYELVGPDGRRVRVICDMDRKGGGWGLALRMDTDADQACPPGWLRQSTGDSSPEVCTRPLAPAASAAAATFPAPQAAYQEVLGRAEGLQFQSMDGFAYNGGPVADRSLGGIYVDGVSITAGTPAEHVWTYAVAWSEDDNIQNSRCPCQEGAAPPDFVGDHMSCEAGVRGVPPIGWYVDDPLWDADGDGDLSSCDTLPAPGDFHVVLQREAKGPLVVRLMADQESENEDVGLNVLELWVR